MSQLRGSDERSPGAPAGGLAGQSNPLMVPSGGTARGTVTPPPSKSVSHRYLNLSLLHGGVTRIDRLLEADDLEHFLAAAEVCGATIERLEHGVEISIEVASARSQDSEERAIYCGNAGTMYRFLIAALAVIPGRWLLDGTPRLRQRPVGPLVSALRELGCDIRCSGAEGYAPLAIRGGSLVGGHCVLDASRSSQFLSALLMAATRAKRPVTVDVEGLTSEPYVAVTFDALEAFGLRRLVRETTTAGGPRRFEIVPTGSRRGEVDLGQRTTGRLELSVEGDYSAAAYPAAAAALTGGKVDLLGLRRSSSQGDRGFLDLLEQLGASVVWRDHTVSVSGGESPLSACDIDLSAMPDQVPTLAALAAFCDGLTTIRNVPHLRLKESDRLKAMALELSKAGVDVVELDDGLEIHGRPHQGLGSSPVVIDSHDDHRIAMSLALVGLRRPGLAISSPEVVAKSYPGFFRDLFRLLNPGSEELVRPGEREA